ncbi:hypothetical protein H072_10647 [Dactylellina haptotyla CBS 200.50]|uniref:FHA domain-containing protein n=1 Tax=Dactylellina haptotyla (strain CBS 200.50) TaxID=1284197 RepID=S8B9Y5_DACHA|nr:hypothetical protein H072_10647 [Dactylellina haptotyla CBS 200.50]
MGRWDSPSPTRARSWSPRDRKVEDKPDKAKKRSRWEEDSDEDRKDSGASTKELARRKEDREDRERRKYDDRDRDRERRRHPDEDDEERKSRRDRDRDRDRSRDRDRYRDRDRERDRRRERPRHRDRRRSRSRSISHRDRKRDRSLEKEKDTDRGDVEGEDPEAPPKEQPNFNRTSHLVAETNTFNGVVLKYVEPPEARLPPSSQTYRLFIFKASDVIDTIPLSTRTAWLVGRDRLVADLPIDHPSASKQHAVIQFRFVVKVNEWGEKEGKVKPYIIDLGSANGTKVNGEEIPKERYYELMEKDVVVFGHSTREYVLMLEK